MNKSFSLRIFVFFLVLLMLFPIFSVPGAKKGLYLWATTIVPALFPFMILIPTIASELRHPKILGILIGYPLGAKLVYDSYGKKYTKLSDLILYNLVSPNFVISFVGSTCYHNITISIILLFNVWVSSFIVGFTIKFILEKKNANKNTIIINPYKDFNFSDNIKNSINTLLIFLGYIILFSILGEIVDNIFFLQSFQKNIVKCFLEFTTGLLYISNSNIDLIYKLIITAFFLSFGCMSIFFQTYMVIGECKKTLLKYILSKLICGILCSLLTYIFISLFIQRMPI